MQSAKLVSALQLTHKFVLYRLTLMGMCILSRQLNWIIFKPRRASRRFVHPPLFCHFRLKFLWLFFFYFLIFKFSFFFVRNCLETKASLVPSSNN